MATLTPQQYADFQRWKQSRASGAGQSGSPLQSGFIGEITKPFRTLGQQITDIGGFLINPNNPIENNSATFLSDAEKAQYWEDPLKGGLQAGAGIGAFAVPAGAGITGLAKSGALSGGLTGFSQTGDLGGAVSGAVTGGATGAGLGLLGKGLKSTLGSAPAKGPRDSKVANALRDFANERDLVAMRKNVGTNAPLGGTKGMLKGAELEKRTLDLSNRYSMPINTGDNLFDLRDAIMADQGGKIAAIADELTPTGVTVDIKPVFDDLINKLNSTRSPKLKQPLQDAIDELTTMVGGTSNITPTDALQIKGELGRLMSSVASDEKTLGEIFRDVYFKLDNQIDSTFKGSGVSNYKDINQDIYAALRIDDWGKEATNKVRPVSAITHTQQQLGMGLGMMAGGPGAIAGAVGSKLLQGPAMEKALSKGARTLANVFDKTPSIQIPTPVAKAGIKATESPLVGRIAPVVSAAATTGTVKQPQSNQSNMQPQIGQATGMGGLLPALSGASSNNQDAIRMAIISDVMSGKMTEAQGSLISKLLEPEAGPKPFKMTEGDKKFALAGQLAQNALGLLESGQVQTGKVSDAVGGIQRFFGTEDPTQTEYRSQIALARTAIRNAMLGANMTEREMTSLEAFIPEFTDEPEQAKAKLRSFIKTIGMYTETARGNEPAVEMSDLAALGL